MCDSGVFVGYLWAEGEREVCINRCVIVGCLWGICGQRGRGRGRGGEGEGKGEGKAEVGGGEREREGEEEEGRRGGGYCGH